MASDASQFLIQWVHNNVNVDAYDELGNIGKRLAENCIADAEAAGFSEDDLAEIAGEDLASYMTDANNARVDEHIQGLVDRDD
jgi:hypothetical protein